MWTGVSPARGNQTPNWLKCDVWLLSFMVPFHVCWTSLATQGRVMALLYLYYQMQKTFNRCYVQRGITLFQILKLWSLLSPFIIVKHNYLSSLLSIIISFMFSCQFILKHIFFFSKFRQSPHNVISTVLYKVKFDFNHADCLFSPSITLHNKYCFLKMHILVCYWFNIYVVVNTKISVAYSLIK